MSEQSEHRSAEKIFSIGEVAIYWRPESPAHGMEVTVASGLVPIFGYDHTTGKEDMAMGYKLRELSPRGKPWAARPDHLRKKRPPREDLKVTRWDECPWQPETLNV